jgi:hypothetical protein
MFDVGRWTLDVPSSPPGGGLCNRRSCSQAVMKFLGVRPFRLRGAPKRRVGATASRPQQATPGWTLGIAPTPRGSRRCCARGQAHSDPLRLRRAAFKVQSSRFKVCRFEVQCFFPMNLPSSDRLRNEGKSLLSGRFAQVASFGFQNPGHAAPDRWFDTCEEVQRFKARAFSANSLPDPPHLLRRGGAAAHSRERRSWCLSAPPADRICPCRPRGVVCV